VIKKKVVSSMKIIVNHQKEERRVSEDNANELIAELLIRWIGNREKKKQEELYSQCIKYLEDLIKQQENE